jgi:hypothetical protein
MYGWPRVLVRDGIVLFFAGLFTMAETDVPESAPPVRPPCGHTDWRQILSFLLALSVAIVLIEALNLSAFHINRKSDLALTETWLQALICCSPEVGSV